MRYVNTTTARRCCWVLAIVVCLVVTLVYGGTLIERYMDYPIRTEVGVSHDETMPLPAITICPADRFDLTRLDQLWHRHFGNSAINAINATRQYQQLADLMDVHTLWQHIAYRNAVDLIPLVMYTSHNIANSNNDMVGIQ